MMELRSIVRATAAAAFLLTAGWAQAASYSGLIVFGDSLSDSGNNKAVIGANAAQIISGNSYVPSQPYASGTYSNGTVWAQQLATSMGITLTPSVLGGSNYAFGGARTAVDGAIGGFPYSLNTQIGQFTTAHPAADPNALYVVAGGGNDARAFLTLPVDPTAIASFAAGFAASVGTLVDNLQAAGAQHIVVWNVPNLGLAPAVTSLGAAAAGYGSLVSSSMNAALSARLASEGPDVLTFDGYSLMTGIVSDPAANGFVNVTAACGATSNACDASTALFWDGIHPTSFAQSKIAAAVGTLAGVTPVPEPATVLTLAVGLAAVGAVARRRKAVASTAQAAG